MTRILSVVNQKGGVGKTTTTVNLGVALADAGRRVLLVDLDPQAQTTFGVGVDPESLRLSLYDVLSETAGIREVLLPTSIENLDLLPAHINLAAAESDLLQAMAREQLLRNALAVVRDDYDYILIDCPPSLGILTVNALTAADELIVPMQAQLYSFLGFTKLLETVSKAQRRVNPRLKIRGVLITQYNERTVAQREFMEQLTSRIERHIPIFETKIKHATGVHEAELAQQPLVRYAGKSPVALAYRELAKELLRDEAPRDEAAPAYAAGSSAERQEARRG